jgi:UDP-glucose 4-epimerase
MTRSPRRVLVTGGAGFIGSHLVELLLARGERVRVLDSLVRGSRRNLADALGAELIVGDIRDERVVARAMAGVDVVFHLAALTSVAESMTQADAYMDVCGAGTLAVMLAARAAGVRRLVYASTSAVYGDPATLPVDESTPTSPGSAYARGKLIGERVCELPPIAGDVATVRLRFFNVYGPRQDGRSSYAGAIAAFLTAIREDRPVTVCGDGQQTRDFIHVADVANACTLAADAPGAAGQVFNIGTGVRTSVLDLVDAARRATGRHCRVLFQPGRDGEVRHSVAGVTAAREALGFTARIGLQDGLAAVWSAAPRASAA